MAQLVVKDLNKIFGQGTSREIAVLKKISFSIEKREIVGIVGPSGAGKSTLLQIMGILDRPTSGTVQHNGTNPFELTPEKLADFRNSRVGFVFQFHHLLPEFTALENVMMPLLVAGRSRRAAADAATAILEKVGLAQRLSHRPGELSGGEQQRVAVARAAVHQPEVILADEPTGNLDRNTGEKVFDLLLDLNQSLGITLVVVTHSMELAGKMKRVLRLLDGELVSET